MLLWNTVSFIMMRVDCISMLQIKEEGQESTRKKIIIRKKGKISDHSRFSCSSVFTRSCTFQSRFICALPTFSISEDATSGTHRYSYSSYQLRDPAHCTVLSLQKGLNIQLSNTCLLRKRCSTF